MGSQVFVPMLSYEDGHGMMDWLRDVLGLEERERWADDDGALSHGELALDGQTIMLAMPTPLYRSPRSVRSEYPPAAEWAKVPYVMNGVLVYVQDVAAVFARATGAGALILSSIEVGFPGKRFRMEDPEGQRWYVFERSSVEEAQSQGISPT